MPEAKASANEQSCQKFLCCPSKLSFWINISATFFTVPASKSRVSWVQGCFSALDSNLSQGSLRRLQCTGLLFVCRCLHLPGSGWIRGCSDVLLSGRHRGHAELFCDELSRSRGLSHGTGGMRIQSIRRFFPTMD